MGDGVIADPEARRGDRPGRGGEVPDEVPGQEERGGDAVAAQRGQGSAVQSFPASQPVIPGDAGPVDGLGEGLTGGTSVGRLLGAGVVAVDEAGITVAGLDVPDVGWVPS